MKEDIKKAFEEALKFKKCQEQSPEEFCIQYVKGLDNCGACPYYIEESTGYQAEEKVLDYALDLFEVGKLNTL